MMVHFLYVDASQTKQSCGMVAVQQTPKSDDVIKLTE
jgi:hypothetical protein